MVAVLAASTIGCIFPLALIVAYMLDNRFATA
jgi:hypothetical protein